MRKKIFAALVSMLFAAALFSGISAHAAEIIDSGFCGAEGNGSNLTWTLDSEGTLRISGNGDMMSLPEDRMPPWYDLRESVKTVIIDDGVTSTCNWPFINFKNLTDITIPESIVFMDVDAFYGCDNLRTVHISSISSWCGIKFKREDSNPLYYGADLYVNGERITDVVVPEGVKSIGNFAFVGYKNLSSITIPNSVTSIGISAFWGTDWYNSQPDGVVYAGKCLYKYKGEMPVGTNIEIKPGTLVICDSTFRDCKNLVSVTIPDSVMSIGYSAFSSCSSLSSITIPDSVTSINSSAFSGCASLFSITIPNGVTSIDGSAFSGCTSLSSITIPDSVTSIGWGAFSGCSSLSSISIPESVTGIEDLAFYDCEKLNAIKIHDSVTSIGGDAFRDTDWYNSQPDGVVYAGKCLYKYKGEIPVGATIEIKPGTLVICDSAFRHCKNLVCVIIPGSVMNIGRSAFSDCSNLTSITIPESVTNIGDCAFSDCSSLTSIFIPESVTNIGDSAFSNCKNLTNIVISGNVTNIGDNAFLYCWNLTSVNIPSSVTSIGSYVFFGCGSLTSIAIPEGVTNIGDCAFSNCSSLTSITIPESVTSIGISAFGDCSNLTSITITSSLISVSRGAFYNCKNLVSITIPDGVKSIEDLAFYGCDSLTSITIPESVTRIGFGIFDNCYNFNEIRYTGTKEQWDSINFHRYYSLKAVKTIYNYTPSLPILSTDIRSYVFGSEIESYNVNGSTCIVAEDLINYGFTVVWDGEARTLSITHPSDDFTQTEKKNFGAKSGNIGEKLTETVPTDIITYVNGEEVDSFNIGGRTVIYIDALGVFGGVTWDGEKRTISVG